MPFFVNLSKADVAATTRYILIDKSSSSYPHAADKALGLRSLSVQVDKEGSGDWVLRIGVVEEVDATDGSVRFFYVRQIRGISNLLEQVPFNPAHGRVLSEDTVLGSEDVADSANWQTDVTLDNPTGTNTGPGAGDIVVELEEVDGTATVSFSITAEYGEAN